MEIKEKLEIILEAGKIGGTVTLQNPHIIEEIIIFIEEQNKTIQNLEEKILKLEHNGVPNNQTPQNPEQTPEQTFQQIYLERTDYINTHKPPTQP